MRRTSAFILLLLISSPSLFGNNPESEIIRIKAFPLDFELYVKNRLLEPLSCSGNIREYSLPPETTLFSLRSKGYLGETIELSAEDNSDPVEVKLERNISSLRQLDIIDTGGQPKSVEFSPEGDYFVTALLSGSGFELYSTEKRTLLRKINLPEEWGQKRGFVETAFFKTRNEMWVSQMTTGKIHAFDTETWKLKRSFDSGGIYPKVITLNDAENLAFISNWVSESVSIIDTTNYAVVKTIPVNGIPRGMAVSKNQDFLYVSNFTSGDINKIDIEKMFVVKNIDLGDGALRHIVIDREKNTLYVSDMFYGKVHVVNLADDTPKSSFYAGSNVNTIKLSPDGKKLYISSRGRNGEQGYLYKGPEFGKILVYDTELKKITDWIWGGNQPTGLALSPDGKIMAFTDFLDHRIEIYSIAQ